MRSVVKNTKLLKCISNNWQTMMLTAKNLIYYQNIAWYSKSMFNIESKYENYYNPLISFDLKNRENYRNPPRNVK